MFLLTKKTIIALFCLLFQLQPSEGSRDDYVSHERKLHKRLFNSSDYYSVDLLPRLNKSHVINIWFGFELVKIVEVNAKEQSIIVIAWVTQRWENPLLCWNESEFGGIEKIHLEAKKVWVPDILLYNNNDDEDHFVGGRSTFRSGVTLNSNGTTSWGNPMIFTSVCKINVKYFPFDTQECQLKFGSWNYDAHTLNITPIKHYKFPSKDFQENGEWKVIMVKIKRKEEIYQCCTEPYVDVTVTIKMARQSMDYFIKFILPCCLISSMIFLGFVLPPESGERIGLSITVLLAMTVFQQLTSEIMPPYDFPILGQYYFAIILEIGASVVVTTMILNFYHRTNRKMPRWMKKLVINWMAVIVFLTDTPETRKIKRRKSSRRSRRKITRLANDNAIAKLTEDGKDQHSQGFNVTFSDTMYCGTPSSETIGTEMENLGCQNNYGINAFQFMINNHEGVDNTTKEETRSYREDGEHLSEDELAIRHWEWTLVARILDRFFLVVAVICGIVTVSAIFLRAPKLWNASPELTKNNAKLMVDE